MTDNKLRNNELQEIYDKWFADLYELEETETEDVLLLLSLLGSKPLKVLEPACGSGRILVPLAKAGHQAAVNTKSSGLFKARRSSIYGF